MKAQVNDLGYLKKVKVRGMFWDTYTRTSVSKGRIKRHWNRQTIKEEQDLQNLDSLLQEIFTNEMQEDTSAVNVRYFVKLYFEKGKRKGYLGHNDIFEVDNRSYKLFNIEAFVNIIEKYLDRKTERKE